MTVYALLMLLLNTLQVKGTNSVLPLYAHLTIKTYFDHTFDQAMIAFLDCFGELVRFLECRTNTVLNLPYPIVKHNLEDPQTGGRYSIK